MGLGFGFGFGFGLGLRLCAERGVRRGRRRAACNVAAGGIGGGAEERVRLARAALVWVRVRVRVG